MIPLKGPVADIEFIESSSNTKFMGSDANMKKLTFSGVFNIN